MLQLTAEQLEAAERGDAVIVDADGKAFILLSRAVYDDELDFSPWSQQEIDMLADEAAEMSAGDGLDETDA